MGHIDKKDVKIMKVSKLLTDLPAVIWNEQIVPILEAAQLKAPRSNFDVYRYINVNDFIKNASEKTLIKLLAACLKRCNARLQATEKDGETIITIKCNGDKGLLRQVAESVDSYEAGRKGIEIQDVQRK
jgi:uncharacterized protein (UPF0264 family)